MEVQVIPSSSENTTTHSDPRRWLMLAVILFAALMGAIDTFIVNVAMPSIEDELHASFAEVQLVVAGYTLAYAVLLVTGGRLGDLYGRKRLFLLGVAGFTLFSALCGFAPNALLLIIFRVAQGALAALMIPQVVSFIQVSFEPSERQVAFSGYTATIGIASMLGQVVGGLLLTANIFNMGWRSIFLVNVPLGIVALLAAAPLVRESRLSTEQRLDFGGTTLFTVFLFLLVFPLVQGGSNGWPLWSLVCLVLAVPCLIAFIVHERSIIQRNILPLVSFALFRLRRFTAGIITILLHNAMFGSFMFLVAFYLQTSLRFSPLQSGLIVMVLSIFFIIASTMSPTLARRMGNRSLTVAAIVVAAGYTSVLLAARFFVPLWGILPLLVAFALLGFGNGLLVTPLLHKMLEGVEHNDVGTASGVYTTVQQTANALGVAIIGLIFSALAASSDNTLYAFVVSMLIIAILSLGLSLTVLPFRS